MKTPILFLIFNRPDTTQLVFEEIKKVKPKYLYVASDGARLNILGEKEKCEASKKIIFEGVDWDCEVKTLFRNENLGCGKAVSSAIDWFFENVEQGIILEDDCLPDLSFFSFCESLLEFYKDEKSIMHISGNNFQISNVSNDSYYFSNSCYIWGWATWRRAWKLYDFDMENYSSKIDFSNYLHANDEKKYWRQIFGRVKKKQIDTWDYQWFFSCWYNGGLGIMPQYNLVKNIGFRSDATHTTHLDTMSNLKIHSINTVIHPKEIKRNVLADYWHSRILHLYEKSFYEFFLDGVRKYYHRNKKYKWISLIINDSVLKYLKVFKNRDI